MTSTRAGRVGSFEQRNGAEHVDAIVAGRADSPLRRGGDRRSTPRRCSPPRRRAAGHRSDRRRTGRRLTVELDAPPSGRHRPGLVDERDVVTSVVTETAMAQADLFWCCTERARGSPGSLQHLPQTAQLLGKTAASPTGWPRR
ncbi:MAG: hypothetical protein WKF83_08355 [Nocardioidaceae bacterium]